MLVARIGASAYMTAIQFVVEQACPTTHTACPYEANSDLDFECPLEAL